MSPTPPPRPRGRPRSPVPDDVRAEVERLATQRGWGRARISARLKLPDWQVRQVLEEAEKRRQSSQAAAWNARQRDILRERVGEQSPKRLAREVSKVGPTRTEAAVRKELVELDLAGCEPVEGMPRGRYTLPDMRPDMTLEQVEDVTGIPRSRILSRIERGELHGRKEDGAWRVWPTKLREWLLGPGGELLDAVVGRAVAEPRVLRQFLTGELGQSEESEKRGRRARRAGGGA